MHEWVAGHSLRSILSLWGEIKVHGLQCKAEGQETLIVISWAAAPYARVCGLCDIFSRQSACLHMQTNGLLYLIFSDEF